MSTDARSRWHTFLGKIAARHRELLEGAREALPGLIESSGYDVQPFLVAMMAVRSQCLGLAQKIDQTFSGSAERALEAEGFDVEPEAARGRALERELELALEQAEVELPAAGAEVILARAREVLAKTFPCTRCGAPLSLRPATWRAQHVTCAFCQTVNTFEPGREVRLVEHFAVHALAERTSWPQKRALLQAERGGAARASRIELHTRYVDAYLAARVALSPDLAADLQKDREGKLRGYTG